MNQSVPPSVAEWREFFRSHAAQIISEDPDGDQSQHLKANMEAGRLGNGPATAAEIAAVEERIGVRLPPSYRNFLMVSNGWDDVAHSKVEELRTVDKIGWLPEVEPELWAAWWPDHLDDREAGLLKRCLLISDSGNGDYWILSASEIAENDEWTAYEWWASGGGDLVPHDSFAALVVAAQHAYATQSTIES